MTLGEIRNILIEILQKSVESPIDPATLRDEVDLRNDLGVDSMSLVEMTWGIEEKLGVAIPDNRMKEIKTVGDVIKLTAELVKAKEQAA